MSIAVRLHEGLHRRLVFDRRLDRLVAAIDGVLPAECRIVDIGCGNGELGARLAHGDRTIVGVETLRRESCEIPLTMYDGTVLPFGDAAFDRAVIVDVLHHAADPRAVIAEALRVAPGGVVIKDHYAESRRDRLTLGAMDWVGNRQFGVGRDGAYLSRAEWADMWAELGLRPQHLNVSLDLYPRLVKPLFENGLHFVASLVPR